MCRDRQALCGVARNNYRAIIERSSVASFTFIGLRALDGVPHIDKPLVGLLLHGPWTRGTFAGTVVTAHLMPIKSLQPQWSMGSWPARTRSATAHTQQRE